MQRNSKFIQISVSSAIYIKLNQDKFEFWLNCWFPTYKTYIITFFFNLEFLYGLITLVRVVKQVDCYKYFLISPIPAQKKTLVRFPSRMMVKRVIRQGQSMPYLGFCDVGSHRTHD